MHSALKPQRPRLAYTQLVIPHAPLCENMTSSTKAEVHNILHCRQRLVGWLVEKLTSPNILKQIKTYPILVPLSFGKLRKNYGTEVTPTQDPVQLRLSQ